MLIAICDDNKHDQVECKRRLEQLAFDFQTDVEFALYQNGDELLFHLEEIRNQPDIIYLDMAMDGLPGYEVAEQLRERGCISEIIFFTVSKACYLRAFDVHALHYIVKGETTVEKFKDIFLRAVKTVEEKQKEYIMCTGAGEFRNIEIKKIRYFEVVKRIVTVYYGQGESFSFYSTIGKIELRLCEHGFIRIHRAYLVALSRIKTVTFKDVVLDSQEVLPVGRSYYTDLKREMSAGMESDEELV